MIEYVLPSIKDASDYLTALSLFKADTPLTGEEAETLGRIYQRYGRDVDNRATAKLYIALDLLPGRTEEHRADFAGLELPDADLDALFLAKGIITGQLELTPEAAGQAVEAVTGGTLTRPVDIILARLVLDTMTGSRNFGGLREQVQALAEFLVSVGDEELDRYSVIMEEARIKCRR